MISLAIRTDSPRVYLSLANGYETLAHKALDAHRELARDFYIELDSLIKRAKIRLYDIDGIICYQGPGSFTGLRIGLSAANALAYALNIPVVATGGDDWIAKGTALLVRGENQKVVVPFYGAEAHITSQKK